MKIYNNYRFYRQCLFGVRGVRAYCRVSVYGGTPKLAGRAYYAVPIYGGTFKLTGRAYSLVPVHDGTL